jgi:hypothetical protein
LNFQILVFAVIEILLMLLSFGFLSAGAEKAALRWAGAIALCMTFCWSIWLGCILALHQMTVQI